MIDPQPLNNVPRNVKKDVSIYILSLAVRWNIAYVHFAGRIIVRMERITIALAEVNLAENIRR